MQHDAACLLWYHILSGPSAREGVAAAGAVPACTLIVSNPDSTPLDQTCALGEASCLTAACYELYSAAGYAYSSPPVAGTALCHVHFPCFSVMIAANMVMAAVPIQALFAQCTSLLLCWAPSTVPGLKGSHFTMLQESCMV